MVGMPTNFQMDHGENVIMQLNSLYVMDRESEMSESNNLDMDFPFKQKKNKKNNRNCVERENTFLLQNMRLTQQLDFRIYRCVGKGHIICIY